MPGSPGLPRGLLQGVFKVLGKLLFSVDAAEQTPPALRGGGAVSPCLFSVTEVVGPQYRRTVGILYQTAFSVGLLVFDAIAYAIPHWRWLQLTVTLPSCFFLLFHW